MTGILTFHKAINYGAVLQAYALRTAIEQMGEPCSVINYAGEKMLRESKTFYFPRNASVVSRAIALYRLPMRARTVRKFNSFLSHHLNLSGPILSDAAGLEALSSQYDHFITGSDQVFNYKGTGEDFNFYLEFEKSKEKKIAYAPSFGLSEIDEGHRERVANALNDFFALSVREQVGEKIVEDLIGVRPLRVCDPTFLLKKEQWEQLCKAPKYKKPYVLVYSFGSCHLEDTARRIAEEIGGTVVNINRGFPTVIKGRNVKNAYAPGPREFLGLIRNASAVVTNSFHGMALSVLLEKEFYAFTNNYANSSATNPRFQTLSESLGLSDRVYSIGTQIERSKIDYAAVKERIEKLRGEGLAFLSRALNKGGV